VKYNSSNSGVMKLYFLFFSSLLLSLLLLNCSGRVKENTNRIVPVKSNINNYGFSNDSLKVDTVIVGKNKPLADVLLPFNIPYLTILKMASVDKDVFNARKVVPGSRFLLYSLKDSTKKLCCIVYEKDPVNYVIFDFGDTLKVIEGKKNVIHKERTASGVIDNSLFQTLSEQNISTDLALKLSEIFAWQIDFYRLRKGDYFKVVYDENIIDKNDSFVGRIKAAVFHHFKKDFYAFYFNQDNELDYFDENGNSLRKAFLRAPLKFSRISSRFSRRRYHPIFHKYKAHLGIDFAAPTGAPVHAIGDGVVIAATYRRGNGRYIKIRHNSTYESGYLHLSRFAKGIRVGKTVKQGQTIGYVGMTGFATGSHLDLRFWKNGQLVNYLKMDFPPSKPIEKKYRKDFEKVKDIYLKKINKISVN